MPLLLPPRDDADDDGAVEKDEDKGPWGALAADEADADRAAGLGARCMAASQLRPTGTLRLSRDPLPLADMDEGEEDGIRIAAAAGSSLTAGCIGGSRNRREVTPPDGWATDDVAV